MTEATLHSTTLNTLKWSIFIPIPKKGNAKEWHFEYAVQVGYNFSATKLKDVYTLEEKL